LEELAKAEGRNLSSTLQTLIKDAVKTYMMRAGGSTIKK
jgi:hypothetical protein